MTRGSRPGRRPRTEEMKLWGVFAFALIGATATTFAVTRLRRTVDWVYSQLNRSRESAGSFRTAFQEDAWKRYNKWMQESYEEEMERVVNICSAALWKLPLVTLDYSLKQYLLFVEKLLKKSLEISSENQEFTPDVERALWSAKLKQSQLT